MSVLGASASDGGKILGNARVVTPGGVLERGWVSIEGGRVVRVESGRVPAGVEYHDLDGNWLVPGFVDLHVHGGGGHDFTRSCADIEAGVAFHRGHGTTTTLVSLMAGPLDDVCTQLGWIAELTARAGSGIAGSHLEGPFLSHSRCGAQNPTHLRRPDRQELAKLLEAGQGTVRSVTVAPELPGALDLIDDVVAFGALAAVGHTDADYGQAAAAFDRGATLATHLFNAMPEFRHRAPGPVGAVFDRHIAFELVNDGTHVDPTVVRVAAHAAGQSLVLVTDAISAAGVGDGDFSLGDQPVRVAGGAARLAGGSQLAGSVLTMDAAFRRAVQEIGLSMEQAVHAASALPAELLGLADRGALEVDRRADLLVLDDDLNVAAVMTAGVFR